MPDPTIHNDPAREVADQLSDSAQKTREAIADAAQKAKGRAKELGRTAADKVDEQRSSVAEALHGASSALNDAAQKLPGEKIPKAARAAAGKLESAAAYVEENDAGELVEDMLNVVKHHPGKSLLIAGCLGFFAGAAMRRR